MTPDQPETDTRERTADEHRSVDHRSGTNDSRTDDSRTDDPKDVRRREHDGRADDATADTGSRSTLLDHDERSDLRDRWDRLQTRFVDDPEGAAEEADELLSEALDRVAERWQQRHRTLRRDWRDRDGVSTEELRTSLKRYRDAFERLIAS